MRASLEAEGRYQVFVKLEPHGMAGVSPGPINPTAVPGSHPVDCRSEPSVIPAEPLQHGTRPGGDPLKLLPQTLQFPNDLPIPVHLAVIVEGERVGRRRPDLPVSTGLLQPPVERQKPLIDLLNHLAPTHLLKLRRQLPLVLHPPSVGQRPPTRPSKLTPADPPISLVVQQQIRDHLLTKPKPPRNAPIISHTLKPNPMQHQQPRHRTHRPPSHPPTAPIPLAATTATITAAGAAATITATAAAATGTAALAAAPITTTAPITAAAATAALAATAAATGIAALAAATATAIAASAVATGAAAAAEGASQRY